MRDDQGQQWSYARADTEQCQAFQTDIDNPDGSSTGFACAVASSVEVPPAVGAPAVGAPPVPAPTIAPPANGPDEAATRLLGAEPFDRARHHWRRAVQRRRADVVPQRFAESRQYHFRSGQGIDTNNQLVTRRGIAGATGQLQAPTAGDDYPLQTAKAAFDSLAARPQPMIAMYCGPVPGGPNRFGGVSAEVATSAGGTVGCRSTLGAGALKRRLHIAGTRCILGSVAVAAGRGHPAAGRPAGGKRRALHALLVA